MHALPLLATLVDPYQILFGQIVPRHRPAVRLGDEPNREAATLQTARRTCPSRRARDSSPRASTDWGSTVR
jgi:hypothetical protein